MKRTIGVVVLALAVGVVWAQGKAVQGDPKVPSGVNWQGQVIRATGAGAPDMKASSPAQARLGAEMAAKMDALRQLLSQVKGVSIDSSTKMDDAMKKDTAINAKVEGVVKGFKVVGKRYFSDNGVEVDVEVSTAMLTDAIDPDPAPVAAPGKPDGEKKNTGLVIDARGLKVMPALAPRVLDDAGKPVYTIDSLSAEARKSAGVASYMQSLEEAQKSLKAGDKPLVIKAAKANGSDLQLAADDAKKLSAMNTGLPRRGQGRHRSELRNHSNENHAPDCAVSALSPPPRFAQATVVTKEGTGEAAIIAKDEQKAFDEAKDKALRNAVEQAAGVRIDADTAVINNQLVRDQVFANTTGYVKKYDVLSKKAEKGVMTVVVKADVITDNLDKDITAARDLIKRAGRPSSIMVLVQGADPADLRQGRAVGRHHLRDAGHGAHRGLQEPTAGTSRTRAFANGKVHVAAGAPRSAPPRRRRSATSPRPRSSSTARSPCATTRAWPAPTASPSPSR